MLFSRTTLTFSLRRKVIGVFITVREIFYISSYSHSWEKCKSHLYKLPWVQNFDRTVKFCETSIEHYNNDRKISKMNFLELLQSNVFYPHNFHRTLAMQPFPTYRSVVKACKWSPWSPLQTILNLNVYFEGLNKNEDLKNSNLHKILIGPEEICCVRR